MYWIKNLGTNKLSNNTNSYNFTINRGSTKVVTVEYTDSAGDVVDLTNYNARMYIRPEPVQPSVLELHSTGSSDNFSGLNITAPSGSIRIYLSAADSDLLTADVYFYDLEIYTTLDPYSQSDPEYVKRILEGTIQTKFNITR